MLYYILYSTILYLLSRELWPRCFSCIYIMILSHVFISDHIIMYTTNAINNPFHPPIVLCPHSREIQLLPLDLVRTYIHTRES